jgi:hypothetical protein
MFDAVFDRGAYRIQHSLHRVSNSPIAFDRDLRRGAAVLADGVTVIPFSPLAGRPDRCHAGPSDRHGR